MDGPAALARPSNVGVLRDGGLDVAGIAPAVRDMTATIAHPPSHATSRRVFAGAVAMAFALGACTTCSPSAAPLASTSSVIAPATTPPPAAAPDAGTVRAFADAVRSGDHETAARRIDALGESERKSAEVRYARARIAHALGDHARVVQELSDLEKHLPIVVDDIAELRAAAQLEVGPHAAAAAHFAGRSDAASLVRATLAFERAGDLDKARVTVERAVTVASAEKKGRRDQEAEARAARARLAEARKDEASAVADLLWLATVAPAAPAAADADERLSALRPAGEGLTRRQRMARALVFAEEGDVKRVERELARMDGAPGPEPSRAELAYVRAWALYTARADYPRAADLFTEASRGGSANPARDRFYAARALSRAHRDDDALEGYRFVAKTYPRSSYAENARYLAARLHYISGRWDDAERAYEAYLDGHRKRGRYVAAARYELAVTLLAAERGSRAAKALSKLRDDAKDARDDATLAHLEGVAHAVAGRGEAAAKRFEEVIRSQPLSFAALASAARLHSMKKTPPPPIPANDSKAAPGGLDVELPPRAALFARLGFDADAEEELRTQEERIKRQYEPRGDEALCAAYGKLERAARRYRVGQRAVRWAALVQAPSDATQWTWDCLYPRPHAEVVSTAAKEWNLEADLVYAIIRQESAFQPDVVSSARAVGLMQLIPPTAASVATELSVAYDPQKLTTPHYNVRFGSYYLRKVLDTFGGRVELAAAAYNAGPTAVTRWLESGEALPLDVWVARIPYGETRKYVDRVVGNLARYAYLAGGEASVPRLNLEIPKGLRAADGAY